jgi:hypothetical protein
MNVEIGTEAAQFPKREYTNGIFFAMYRRLLGSTGTFKKVEIPKKLHIFQILRHGFKLIICFKVQMC